METSDFGNSALSKKNKVLWDVLLNGEGLFFLLKHAADLMGCTVVLRCSSVYWAEPGVSAQNLDQKSASRFISWCETKGHAGVSDELSDIPAEFASFAHAAICFPLTLHGKKLGILALCSSGGCFSDEEKQLGVNLSGMCAMLLGGTPFTGSSTPHYSALFDALLSGETVNPSFAKSCPNLPAEGSERSTQVLIIDPKGASIETTKCIRDTCCTMVTCSMCTFHRGYIVMLYHGKKLYPLSEHHNFLEYLRRTHCAGGLSRSFTDLSQTASYFEQARMAMLIGAHLLPGEVLHDYENHAQDHIILLAGKQLPQNALISPALQALCEIDAPRGGELLGTLRCYLLNINNLSAAADALHIHRNTLFYRLRKIEDITGWDLDCGSCLNNVSFYLRVMDLESFPHDL